MAKCTPTAWSDPNFPPPPISIVHLFPDHGFVVAHQRPRRKSHGCWSKFFNSFLLALHRFLIDKYSKGYFPNHLSSRGRGSAANEMEISKSPSIDNRATAGQRRVRQTKGRGGGEKRSTCLSSQPARPRARPSIKRAAHFPTPRVLIPNRGRKT